MLRSDSEKEHVDSGPIPAGLNALYIPADTRVAGPVETAQPVWVAGTVEGDIHTEDEIVLTEKATVRGAVRARSADVGGVIEGGITVSGQLVLEETARIRGDIAADQLIVEEGARFSGDCRMETARSASAKPESHARSARDRSESEADLGAVLGA